MRQLRPRTPVWPSLVAGFAVSLLEVQLIIAADSPVFEREHLSEFARGLDLIEYLAKCAAYTATKESASPQLHFV